MRLFRAGLPCKDATVEPRLALRNIVASGRVGLLCVVPGKTETVRVNGRAWVTIDQRILERFTLPKPTKSAIVVQIDSTFVHCAKAFMRSGMWDPQTWARLAETPDAADILACQGVVDEPAVVLRQHLDDGYLASLEAER